MNAPVFFCIFNILLEVCSWDASHGFGESSSHNGRPRRSRTITAEPTDSITVDGRAHAAHFHATGAHSGEAEESGRSAEQAEDEAVLDSMGLSEEAGKPATTGRSFMKRQSMHGGAAERGTLAVEDEAENHDFHHGYELPDESDSFLEEFAEQPHWAVAGRAAVDCTYQSWTGWTGCSKTCDAGTQKQSRAKNGPYYGGKGCAYAETTKQQTCNPTPCPVPCTFTGWSGWNVCSLTCGSGQKVRTRAKDGPYHGGTDCHGHSTDTGVCNAFSCPVDCLFQPWSAWGACSKTCIQEGNYGYKTRDRAKVGPFSGGKACHGHVVDDGLCNSFTCPYDCEVGAWGSWSACTQSCSVSTVTHGYKIRSRTSLAASNGGKMCAENWQMNHCNTRLCAFDCFFLEWGAWGPCSKTCTENGQAAGMRERVRDKVGPGMGGGECHGAVTNTMSCNDYSCPVDCKWNAWGSWSACTTSCAIGAKLRTRDFTPATFGGKACEGPKENHDSCSNYNCPTDCRWTLWDAWMPCSRSCGLGSSHRSRSYDPKPQNGGMHCQGAHMEMIDCNGHACPIDCEFEQWLDWSLCSSSCGKGVRTRVRLVNITAGFGGSVCKDDPSQEHECPEQADCPKDCRFDEWSEWEGCDEACITSNSTRVQSRVLLQAENGGLEECPKGDMERREKCKGKPMCASKDLKAAAPPSHGLQAFSMLVVNTFLARSWELLS